MVRARHCVIMLFCLLFSSCTKQHSSNHEHENKKIVDNAEDIAILDAIIQQEAMLVDIPIPLYNHRIIPYLSDKAESETLVFGYQCPLSPEQAILFFMTQMERYGWKHQVTFHGDQSLVQFESPDRYCTIAIKKIDDSLACSAVFIYIKRASTDARSE